ncbi:RUN and FYVE domain-containing protein 2-like isoform X2 [Porites lutea]|uniref:RUN and FYVE domain-containing protein 2-like isoform X2 n=1 Tax=Porites lutea TaxID=51062 RepID=UPI003CC5F947
MEAFIIDPARLISDIVGYITELKNIYQTSQRAITDDETTLHKFCVKLETVMRHEQKERYSLLGARKDYWNFISDCIPKDDGIRFVHAVPQVKTPQGKGRAFIRFSLVKRSLADAIQRCLVMRKHLSSCYGPEAILCHPSLSTALINKLYDLNDIEFDLPCAGHELDISWPAFSRRSFDESQGSVSGRRSSISSLTSVDLRQVTHLVSEMSSLRHMLHEKSAQKEQLEEHVAELQGSIERKTCQIRCLNEEVDSSRKRIEFINEEKELLEMEKIETDSKITALKESELSLNSNISLIVEEKCKALNELTLLKSRKADEEKLRLSAQEELAALKEQLEETVESKYKLEKELASITATLQTMDSEKRYLDDQVKTLEEKMLACQDERIGLEDELDVARQQLEAANEARIRAEQGQVKAQEQLESLRCMMDQEIAALKFQLSSETMKYETELKSLSDQIQEYNSVKERLTEQQEVIVDLESKLKERNDTLQHDKHKYVSEIKHLRNEVQQFKSGFDENKLRIRALENELLLTSKQLEEERSRQREMKRKVDEFEEAKGLKDQEYESKIKEVKGDVEELKSRLVEVTKEKAELWQKADAMEHEIKVKADDRWMDDSEASHCLGCHAEFTFLLRKHHCRMCGRIFCYSCSDNWIQTPHSRKLRRVCRQCFSLDQRLKVKHAGVSQCIEDDARSDTSDRLSERTVSFLSDTGGVDAEEGPSTTQPGPSTSRSSHPDPPQSSSTPVKPSTNNTDENEIGDSGTDHTGVKENSLNSPNTTKNVTESKNSDEESDRSSPEVEQREECEEYEIVDTSNGEYACEQPGAQIVLSESDSREELVIPSVNEEPGAFWHATVSPGKRHLIQVMVGTPRASLSWKFSTEKKSIRFGVAFKKSERSTDDESKTVVPLSQYNSHERAVKGEIQDSTPGVYLLVFDNTFSRFTSKRLFCMVQVTRSDNNEDEDDSLT